MNFLKIVQTVVLVAALVPQATLASSGGPPLPSQKWGFQGPFGRFDDAALKRGAQVAVGVCMACHSVKYIKFDSLRQFGFSEAEVIALAESQGRGKKDHMMSAMTPEVAKESFGVVPPDLSLITKARKGYEDYIFALLTGYLKDSETELVGRVMKDGQVSESEAVEISSTLFIESHDLGKMKSTLERIKAGDQFNKYFPGHFLAMPAPLSDGSVTYTDGTENSLKQLSQDLVVFLAWAAEPTLMARKTLGVKVIIYLIVLTVMLYAIKRRIWARVH